MELIVVHISATRAAVDLEIASWHRGTYIWTSLNICTVSVLLVAHKNTEFALKVNEYIETHRAYPRRNSYRQSPFNVSNTLITVPCERNPKKRVD